MSQIKLLHSGGNGVILSAPDSNPASDRTLKLPGDADGTIATTATAGKILQVVQTVKKDSFSTSSSTPVEITGLNASITKTSASNKLLIRVDVAYGKSGRATAQFQLFEDSSEITAVNSTQGSADNLFIYDYTHLSSGTNETYSIRNVSKTFLYDGSNDTSSHTIKVYGCCESSATFYLGRTEHNSPSIGTSSIITIMEVAA